MKTAILSDIHGNLEALSVILDSVKKNGAESIIILGDIIDYGPHSDEVIEMIKEIPLPLICNIWGNHESAVMNEEYERFSSERGRESALFTRNNLSEKSFSYIKNEMTNDGIYEFSLGNLKCLAVHGSLKDIYWKAIRPSDDFSAYKEYDYVFSGHSHFPHFFEIYYDADAPMMRNKKKTVFINPGSVGQPRNHCPLAQYALFDTETGEVSMIRKEYDIEKEQKCFSHKTDVFYKERLTKGV